MADQPRQLTPNIGGNGFVWILLVAAGTYFVAHQVSLEGSRPPTTEMVIPERAGVQDIDARLWQDPFAAVAATLTRSPELKPENCTDPGTVKEVKDQIRHHCLSPLNGRAGAKRLVLLASVSGAPYSEDHESRRRTRYAILAGLNAEGFVPKDPQHIGFYWPRVGAPAESALAFQKVVPFEWFKPKPKLKLKRKADRPNLPYEEILVLWFDEDSLGRASPDQPEPLHQFDEFLCRSLARTDAGGPAPWSNAKILGPQSSTTLQAMADEARKGGLSRVCPEAARPQFYVYSATADDVALIPEYVDSSPPCVKSENCLHAFFAEKGITLHRMIATDEALARTIRHELRLRRIDDKFDKKRYSDIALVSEWDTLYGRALPDSMARCLGERKGCQQADVDPYADKPWLHPFKYLRGLDGQMPNADGLGSGNGSKDTGSRQDKDAKDNAKTRPDAKPQDRAEGQGQFDYLHRLGERMQELDRDLHRDNRYGIEAIGILGSDLYDKLLVLQALRPLFPNALFFTTDLDALILHPIALTSTRNLLVASSYGLRLRDAIQGEIPPFRNSYQTAGFLATRVAIRSNDGPPSGWSMQPLLFEIGTSRVFQFGGQGSRHDKGSEEECKKKLLDCYGVQPASSDMYSEVSRTSAVAFSVLGLCGAMTFRPLRRRIWDRIDAFLRRPTSYAALSVRGATVLIGLCLVVFALAAAIHAFWPLVADALTRDGQPMVLHEGISVWPTIFLRAATLVLCIGLIVHGYRRLNVNIEKLAQDFHLVETRRRVKVEQDDIARKSSPWLRFASHFWFRLPADHAATHRNGERLPQDIFRFWRMYIYQGFLIARVYRIAAAVAAMLMLWLILWLVFGAAHAPSRGSVSFWAYYSVTLAVVGATLALIFFVADTTLLTWRVVKAFRTETRVWPARTLQEFNNRLGLPPSVLDDPPSVLDDWIALLFVSERTKCITTLIYYPFLIIALLVVSNSRLFANYGLSIPDLVTMGIGVLIVAACAIALRSSAEASRARARRRLNDQLIVARNLDDGGRFAGQLEMLLRQVEELRDGAFSPFSQQPLVRATLLPLGGFGGTALLEYLLLPGLS